MAAGGGEQPVRLIRIYIYPRSRDYDLFFVFYVHSGLRA